MEALHPRTEERPYAADMDEEDRDMHHSTAGVPREPETRHGQRDFRDEKRRSDKRKGSRISPTSDPYDYLGKKREVEEPKYARHDVHDIDHREIVHEEPKHKSRYAGRGDYRDEDQHHVIDSKHGWTVPTKSLPKHSKRSTFDISKHQKEFDPLHMG